MQNCKILTSLSEFYDFLWKKKFIIIVSIILILIVYLVRIVNNDIGIDSVSAMSTNMNLNNLSVGRYARVWLTNVIAIKMFNPYISNLMSLLILILSNFVWLYLFYIVLNKKVDAKSALLYDFIFSICYLSSCIWVESTYFVTLAVEFMIGVLMCPVLILLIYKITFNEKIINLKKHIVEISIINIILALVISIYQANIFLYVSGVISVVVIGIISGKSSKEHYNFIFASIIFLAISLVIFKVLNLLTGLILGIKVGGEASSVFLINSQYSLKTMIFRVLANLAYVFLGRIPQIKPTLDTLVYKNATESAVNTLSAIGMESFLYIDFINIAIFLIINVIVNFKKNSIIDKLILLFYVFFAFAPLMMGTICIRAEFQIPVFVGVISCIVIYQLSKYRKSILIVYLLVFSLLKMRDIQYAALLNSSEHLRYENDKRIAENFCNEIGKDIIGEEEDYYIYIVGKVYPPYKKHYVRGEVIGNSVFSWHRAKADIIQASSYAQEFLATLGHNFKNVKPTFADTKFDTDKYLEYLKLTKYMPTYPNTGYVKLVDDVYIVKLSEVDVDSIEVAYLNEKKD